MQLLNPAILFQTSPPMIVLGGSSRMEKGLSLREGHETSSLMTQQLKIC